MANDEPEYEPGWGGLAILLWPFTLYGRIKRWILGRNDETEALMEKSAEQEARARDDTR